MSIKTTFQSAQRNLASLMDAVIEDSEVVIIRRRGKADVALVAAEELSGLIETVHLLRSPANSTRLLRALDRARSEDPEPMTTAELRRAVGL